MESPDLETRDYGELARIEKLRDQLARTFAREILYFNLSHGGMEEGAKKEVAQAYALADAVLAERDKEKT